MTPASAQFRESYVSSDDPDDANPLPPLDPTQTGDLPITPALTSAFLQSLNDLNIDLRFFSGSWESFNLDVTGGPYDIVLTSETIYRTDSLPSLVNLMYRSCKPGLMTEASLEDEIEEKLVISPTEHFEQEQPLCLVAAKLVYFGVGGGVSEFVKVVESFSPEEHEIRRGKVIMVWEKSGGVKRCIMRLRWLSSLGIPDS